MKKYIFTSHFAVKLANNCQQFVSSFLSATKINLVFLIFVFSLQGCSKDNTVSQTSNIEDIAPIEGIQSPESVYTMKDGRIIVSEIGEFGKDGDGKIIEIATDGSKKIIAESGLNDPKGLLVEGSTIYVTDKDEVKKVSFSGVVEKWLGPDDFPRKTQFLNDIAIDKNTLIYISDSGDIKNGGGGAIFRVDSKGKVTVLVDKENDSRILSPNGLSTFQNGYLAFNDFHNGMLFRVRLKDLVVTKLAEGFGGADGLVYSGVNLYLSDWKNGKIWKLDISKVKEDGSFSDPELLKEGFEGSADIDVTPDGKYLVIPEMKANKVVFLPLL
jgi:sugar lactone lactonase YvrE